MDLFFVQGISDAQKNAYPRYCQDQSDRFKIRYFKLIYNNFVLLDFSSEEEAKNYLSAYYAPLPFRERVFKMLVKDGEISINNSSTE